MRMRRLTVLSISALGTLIAVASVGALVFMGGRGQSSAAPERILGAASVPVGQDPKSGVSQSDVYTTVRAQSFATWSYTVDDNGTGDRHAVINYRHDTIADLKAYTAANKALLPQVANFGGQVDVAITFVYPVTVDWFRSWAKDNALEAHDSQMRVLAPGPNGATMSISGKPGDPIPQESVDNMLGGIFTNNVIGVFGVHGKVDSAHLTKLASEPKVFLVDVTPAWTLHDLAQNGVAIQQTPMVDFPYGYMERMGLQNFTDLALPTAIPPPVGTIIPKNVPQAP